MTKRKPKKPKNPGESKRVVDALAGAAAEVSPSTAVDVSEVWKGTLDETWAWIGRVQQQSDPPQLYRNGDTLSLFRPAAGIQPAAIVGANLDGMRAWLVRNINFVKRKYKTTVPTTPPDVLVKLILRDPEWRISLPPINGIVDLPPIQRDGRVNATPGYQAETGLIYVPAPGLEIIPVSEKPTELEVKHEAAVIAEMLDEFPFDSRGSKVNAVSVLITCAVRHLIEGCVPPFGFDGSMPGSGKGLLMYGLTYPIFGATAAGVESLDSEELRKNITTKLLAAEPLFIMDNVSKLVDSAVFASATTGRRWSDRALGHNRNVDLPMRLIFLLTGNQLHYSTENARRIIKIRLEPATDAPERKVFRIEDLEAWVKENRSVIVHAVHTLVRHWVVKGRPEPGSRVPRKGSYNEWRNVVGGILAAAGIEGFLSNDVETQIEDERHADHLRLVGAWWEKYQAEPVNVEQLVTLAHNAGIEFLSEKYGTAKEQLSYRLRSVRGRVFAKDLKVCYKRTARGGCWWLEWLLPDEAAVCGMRDTVPSFLPPAT